MHKQPCGEGCGFFFISMLDTLLKKKRQNTIGWPLALGLIIWQWMKWPFSQKKNKSPNIVPTFCWLWQCYAEAGKGALGQYELTFTERSLCQSGVISLPEIVFSILDWGDLYYICFHFIIEGTASELLSNFPKATQLVGARQPEFEPASSSCTAWAGNYCVSRQKEVWSVGLPWRAMV